VENVNKKEKETANKKQGMGKKAKQRSGYYPTSAHKTSKRQVICGQDGLSSILSLSFLVLALP
jgi:hypothetical protein